MRTWRSNLSVAALVSLIMAGPQVTSGASDTPTRCEPVDAAESDPRGRRLAESPRVRPASVRIAKLLLDGLRQSRTLRAVVEALQTSDAVVYVSMQPNLRDRIGSVQWIAGAGGLRYLQAIVAATASDRAMIAALGHELEHAREVAETTFVTDAASFSALYRSIGERAHGVQGAWETARAYEVGERIARELESSVPLPRQPILLTHPTHWLAIYHCRRATWARHESANQR
jgi:hypothetical protein